jgi:ubiquinone/menaquinone biosynthesis C-methylase UbiE
LSILSLSEKFLLNFHKKYPGCTPDSFSRGLTEDGKTSYDLVALVLPTHPSNPIKVLDLACGDGALLERISWAQTGQVNLMGLDMSEGELGAARRRLASTGITLIQGNAKALPFPDGSFDYVLCHMALMLMDNLDDVVSEIHRVLKPGGTFSAVVGGRREHSMAMKAYLQVLQEIPNEEGQIELPAIGDNRARTEEGIKSLFSEDRFNMPGIVQDFCIHFYDAPKDLIHFFMLMYNSGRFSEHGRATLQFKLLSKLDKLVDQSGKIAHFMWLRHLVFQKLV